MPKKKKTSDCTEVYDENLLSQAFSRFYFYLFLKYEDLAMQLSKVDNIWECCLVTKSCPTLLWPHGPYLTRLPCPWDSPGKNTGVGCHFLLQGIFLTQGSNPSLLHCQVGSLPLGLLGTPLADKVNDKYIYLGSKQIKFWAHHPTTIWITHTSWKEMCL